MQNYYQVPLCSYFENGVQCTRISAIVPSIRGQSFIGCPVPLCEAHALPLIYNHLQGMFQPSQINVFAQPPQIPVFSQPPQIPQVFSQPPPQIPQVFSQPPPQPLLVQQEPITCSICTEEIEHPCELHCKHSYHGKCIDQWFTSLERQERDLTCPNCRSNVTDQDYRKVRMASIDDEYNPDGDSYVDYNCNLLDLDVFEQDLENSF